MTRAEFLKEVEGFLIDAGLTPTQLGWRAMKDPSFVFNLRAGREPREGTRERVLRWMAEHRKAAA